MYLHSLLWQNIFFGVLNLLLFFSTNLKNKTAEMLGGYINQRHTHRPNELLRSV